MDTPTSDKTLADMTVGELRAERAIWDAHVSAADGWGASLKFADDMRLAFDREIDRRANLPVRLQLSRQRGFDLQAASNAINGLACINVARPSKFGNPFTVADCRTAGYSGADNDIAARVVEAFRVWIATDHWRFNWDGPESERRRDAMRKALLSLRGKNVACWCKPGDPCHGDVLLALAAEERG